MSGISLLVDGNQGIYIPQTFAQRFRLDDWKGITEEDFNICLMGGPEHEFYWDAWDTILDNASYTDKDGKTWTLYQDGDLFAFCCELLSDEQYFEFYGVERAADD
jgi:hypothetical protein